MEPRELSRRLFGNSYVLPLCASIKGPHDLVTLTVLTERVGAARQSDIHAAWTRLVRAGLLTPLDVSRPDRSKLFRPAKTKLWVAAQELER